MPGQDAMWSVVPQERRVAAAPKGVAWNGQSGATRSANLPETRRAPDNLPCGAGSMLAASAVLLGALAIYCATVIVARMLD